MFAKFSITILFFCSIITFYNVQKKKPGEVPKPVPATYLGHNSLINNISCTSQTFYHYRNDGPGTHALYGANPDGSYSFTNNLLNSNSFFNGLGLATVDGEIFYELHDDGSGTLALWAGHLQVNGTVEVNLQNADSGAATNTVDFATPDGSVFYFLQTDGSGTLTLRSATLNTGTGAFESWIQLSSDSGAETNTIGMATLDGNSFYFLKNDGSGTATLKTATLNTTTGLFENEVNQNTNCNIENSTLGFATGNNSLTLSTNSPVCVGKRILINAQNHYPMGTLSFSWTGPNSFAATTQNVEITDVTAANAGTYSLTVTFGNGNTATCSVDVALDSGCPASCSCQEYVYVNDLQNNITHKFEMQSSGQLIEVGNPWLSYNGSQINEPHGVSIDPNGKIYIAELGESNYVEVDCDGNITNTQAENTDGFNHVIVDNYMYILFNNQIYVYNLCDASVFFVGFLNLGNTATNTISWGLTYNESDGMLYATDNYTNNPSDFTPGGGDIFVIDPSDPENPGSIWQLHSTINPILTGFDQLMGIVFDYNNAMYFVEQTSFYGTSVVHKYTWNGANWTSAGSVEDDSDDSPKSGFFNAWGITWLEVTNRLLVTSFDEDCLAEIDPAAMTYVGPAVPHVPGARAKGIDKTKECCYNGVNTIDVSICQAQKVLLRNLLSCDVCGGSWTRTSGTGGTYDNCAQTFTADGSTTNSTFTFTANNDQCGAVNLTVNIIIEDLELSNSANCSFDNDGSIDITMTNGVFPYTFDWSDDALDGIEDPTGLSPATYDLTVTDNAGCTVTVSIDVPPCSVVGNRVWLDENSDGIQDVGEPGIPGIVVELQDGTCISGSTCLTTTTDGDGGYLFRKVTPGNYTAKVLSGVPSGLNAIYDEDDGTTSPNMEISVTVLSDREYLSADFGYNYVSKADTDVPTMATTGALGDRVWNDANGNGIQDVGERGIPNITVELWTDADQDGVFTASGTTSTTNAYGNYIFDNLTPGSYAVRIASTDISGAGYDTKPTHDPDQDGDNISNPVIIAPGDVWLNGDFGYRSTTTLADIGSVVFVDTDGNGSYNSSIDIPLGGVSVALIDDTNGNGNWDSGEPVAATTLTAPNGTYLFPDLSDNDYVVIVTDRENVINNLMITVDPDGGNDGYSSVILSGSDELTQNFGYVPSGHTGSDGFIGDLIYLDMDGSSSYTAGEPGIEGVDVQLLDGITDAVLATTTTNENGMYFFGGLAADDYKVKVNSASMPVGLTNSIDPDGSAPGDNITNSFALAAGASDLTKDFGYKATVSHTISGTIWEDTNAEGTLDGTETNRFVGITIRLIDGNDNILATTTTISDGTYAFDQIPDGSYTLEVTDSKDSLLGYWHSLGTDSEPDPRTLTVSGADLTGIDFGYYLKGAAIGNLVWIDYDADHIQDAGEPGLPGAKVTLEIDYNNDGTTDITTIRKTESDGSYAFGGLLLDEDYNASGSLPDYELVVSLPDAEMAAIYTASTADQGGNDKLDSDDHSGHIISVVQGQSDVVIKTDPNTEPVEASQDFGYNLDCIDPKMEYAITTDGSDPVNATQTTDYFWMIDALGEDSTFYHDHLAQKYGRIRSWTYCESGGWHYYYNPQDPDEFLFAIEHGSNTTPVEYIEIRVDDIATDRHKSNDADATFVMVRDWYVKTVNDDPLTANVNIRFYFPPNEYKQMLDAAKTQATAWGTAVQPNETMVQWFKKAIFDPDNDIDEANTILSSFDITNKRATTTDAAGNNTDLASPAVENNKNHIQFNGITGFSGGTAMIHINRASLPVELSHFEGQVQGCNTLLTWYAQTEENFSHYELEWSGDGRHYMEIVTVDGLGSTTTGQTYQYFDELALVHNYYRLKMIDVDGTYKYSKVVHLQTGCGDEHDIAVYPNPIGIRGDVLNIKFFSEREETEIMIVDMLGQVLQQVNVSAKMGWNTLRIRVENLPVGTYFIKQAGSRGAARFVVQE